MNVLVANYVETTIKLGACTGYDEKTKSVDLTSAFQDETAVVEKGLIPIKCDS